VRHPLPEICGLACAAGAYGLSGMGRSGLVLAAIAGPVVWWLALGHRSARPADVPQAEVTIHPPAQRPTVDPDFEPAPAEPFGSAITTGGGREHVAIDKETPQ
jgi:hypothetical protein